MGLDAGLSLTQSDDPRSGGHFTLGTSKTPLVGGQWPARCLIEMRTHPGPARVGSRIIVNVVVVLKVADSQDARLGVVEVGGPIPNGLTTVAADAGRQR